MPNCPRCHQSVTALAVSCPYCRTPLKAYGHPGIPLHRATGEEYLCQSCTYHADNSCTFPQRPYARECTLYQNIAQRQEVQLSKNSSPAIAFTTWVKRNSFWLLLLALLCISFLIAAL